MAMFHVPEIPLENLMTPHAVTVGPDDSLRAVREHFHSHHFHHLLVVEKSRLIGVISDRDLLKNISPFIGHDFTERPQDLATLNKRAHQVMSRHLITASPATLLEMGIQLILGHDVSCLPIVNDHMHPLGIVTWHDILRALVPPNTQPI